MARVLLPLGFRFDPTDEQLVMHFLRKKINGKKLSVKVISEVDIYKFAPWDLPEKLRSPTRDLVWYCFCPRDKKYASGSRTNRATEVGFWKTTGNDKPVKHHSKTVGMRKTLIFHEGKAPSGNRTNWVMHEYRIEDKGLVNAGFCQDAYALCKIFQKSGRGPKNGEQHGAPFIENDWDDDMENGYPMSFPLADSSSPVPGPEVSQILAIESTLNPGNGHDSLPEIVEQSGTLVTSEGHNLPLIVDDTELFDIEQLWSVLHEKDDNVFISDVSGTDKEKDDNVFISNGSGTDKNLDSHISHRGVEELGVHYDDQDIFNGLEDITSHAKLNASDKVHFPNNPEDDYVSTGMLSWFEDGSYIELNDLEANDSENVTTGGPVACNATLGITASEDISNLQGPQEAIHRTAAPIQNMEETAAKFIPQSRARGEHHEAPLSSMECSSNARGSHSKLKLLDAIPGRPPSAAEYPYPRADCDSKDVVLSDGSYVHIQAEVTVSCACWGDGLLSDKSGYAPCMCPNCKSLSKVGRERRIQVHSNSGFMFVFLPGLISALMWLSLLVLCAKLGSIGRR